MKIWERKLQREIDRLESRMECRFRDEVGVPMTYPAETLLGQKYLHEFTHSELIGALIEYLGVKVTPRPAIGGRTETCELEVCDDQG